MRTQVWKEFSFEAAHALPHLHEGHKCRRLHGHSYRVRVTVEGDVDDQGMVVDYDILSHIWKGIHTCLDHQNLNEIDEAHEIGFTTSENLALWIFEAFDDGLLPFRFNAPSRPRVVEVELRETDRAGATVSRSR